MFINLAQNASKYQLQQPKRLNKNTTSSNREISEKEVQ